MWRCCNEIASHGQINGSNEVTFGILLGGTVLFLPVKRLRVVTVIDTLDGFENNQKILYFGRVFGLASKTVN